MSSVLAEFDAEKFEKYVKEVSYKEGLEAGALRNTISLYLKGWLIKANSIAELNISEADFDAAVAKYQDEHKA